MKHETKVRANIFSSGPYVHKLESMRASQMFVYNGLQPISYFKMWIFVVLPDYNPYMAANYVHVLLSEFQAWRTQRSNKPHFSRSHHIRRTAIHTTLGVENFGQLNTPNQLCNPPPESSGSQTFCILLTPKGHYRVHNTRHLSLC
jgi:hypothetical protein